MFKNKYFSIYVIVLLMLCAFLLPIVASWWFSIGST
jgi:hypothetical protein